MAELDAERQNAGRGRWEEEVRQIIFLIIDSFVLLLSVLRKGSQVHRDHTLTSTCSSNMNMLTRTIIHTTQFCA